MSYFLGTRKLGASDAWYASQDEQHYRGMTMRPGTLPEKDPRCACADCLRKSAFYRDHAVVTDWHEIRGSRPMTKFGKPIRDLSTMIDGMTVDELPPSIREEWLYVSRIDCTGTVPPWSNRPTRADE